MVKTGRLMLSVPNDVASVAPPASSCGGAKETFNEPVGPAR